jgi:hypothetical protein
MEGTARLIAWLERSAPLAGDVGGLLFFAYWTTRARGTELPAALSVLLDGATILLVTLAVLGYQLAQGAKPRAWVGWAGVAAIGLGFAGSLSLVASGLVLFGVSILLCGVHPQLPGRLLIAGGSFLLVAQAFAPGFGRADSGASAAWSVLMGLALVGVAGAMADLDVLHRDGRLHELADLDVLHRGGGPHAMP